MKVVWKYGIRLGEQTIEMPAGAKILDVQIQQGQLVMWALVDPLTDEREAVSIFVIGTGHEIYAYNFKHVATVQTLDGALVWHVFRRLP